MKKVKLTSVCRPKQWKSIPISELSDVGYPVYGANGVIGYYDSYNHEQETVIITCRGATCGTVNLTHPRSYVTGNAMCLDNVKDSVDIKYLFYSMQAYDFTKVISGTAQPQITRVGLEKVEFALPSLDVQREIVSILDKIDTLIEKRRLQLKKLDDLIKARFVEMFGDPDTNPKGWNECALSEKLNVVGGYAFKSDGFSEGSGIPVLRIGNINAGFFRPVNLVYWQEDESLDRYAMHPGDLVMSLTGTVGKDDYGNVCILGDDYDMYYLNQRNAKLEIIEGIDKFYLSQLLKFEQIKKKLTGISRGVRQANISNKDILNLVVPVPPMELQSQFADFIKQVDKSKLLSGCRLFHSWAPENRDKPKHVGVPRRRTKDLRGCRRQQ